MDPAALHDDAILIDGLIISKWSRSVFEEMRAGGVTAANCTCSVWEGFRATMENVAQWKRWFREHGDLLVQVHAPTTSGARSARGAPGSSSAGRTHPRSRIGPSSSRCSATWAFG